MPSESDKDEQFPTILILLSMGHQRQALHIQEHIALSSLTTIGLGGEAKYFVTCAAADDIRAAVEYVKSQHLRVQILGGGSNLIFNDTGFNGLVLKVANRGVVWTDEGGSVLASVQAGETWDEFVRACVEHGYSGIECLSGIPGSVGATPIQNVGAYGQEVKDTIVSVKALHRATGEEVEFTNADCGFGYRDSLFKSQEKDRWIVTEVRFRLRTNGAPVIVYPELRRHLEHTLGSGDLGTPATQQEASARLTLVRDAVIALRRKKSMVIDPNDPNTRSVGSFFMNPILGPDVFSVLQLQWNVRHPGEPIPSYPSGRMVKVPAAWLIEHAGFNKGYRGQGGAGISANHTLALVNYGCTTRDVLELAQEIEDRVLTVFGISLEREAIVVE